MIPRLLLTLGLLAGFAAAASAQTTDKITGKVTSVEVRGKTAKLTVATDLGDQTYDITPKVELEIVSTGDDACLMKGLFVKVDAVESNQKYFGTVFSVYPEHMGRIPPAAAVKAPIEAGQSQNRHFVTGEIAAFTPATEPDAKYDLLELKTTGKATLTVYMEKNRTVKVVQSEPGHIEKDQPAVIVGKRAGNKLLPSAITINTGKKLLGDDFQTALKRKK
jgi:hypothetical protein